MPSRHHLTIADKNRLRRHHREHPELTQEQLREWAYASFGQWVARSTVGHIVRAPEECSANPQATRFQSGRYPDMEQELYGLLLARATQMGVDLTRPQEGHTVVMSDAELWTKANEILKRTRGSDESVSTAWVHRFKRRHGLHRSQLKRAAAVAIGGSSSVGGGSGVDTVTELQEQVGTEALQVSVEAGSSAGDTDVFEEEETQPPPRKRPATAAGSAKGVATTATRSHFVSADDVLLLTHVLAVKPWTFPYVMDGWQQVVAELRAETAFRLEKSAGACQARLNLLLSHMSAGNVAALRKSGTQEEFDRKFALIREVSAQMEAHEVAESGGAVSSAAVAPLVPEGAATTPTMPDRAQEREQMAQRRLELMERKMERELAAQKRHSEEQVRRLEKLHHEQQQIQQEQHAQLLTTIQQQQAMMLELIKSLNPAANQP